MELLEHCSTKRPMFLNGVLGGCFRSNIAKMFPENESPGDLRFVKVKNIAELNELVPVKTNHNGEKVGILC